MHKFHKKHKFKKYFKQMKKISKMVIKMIRYTSGSKNNRMKKGMWLMKNAFKRIGGQVIL